MVASTICDSGVDIGIDDQSQNLNHADTIASAMFRDDLQQLVGSCGCNAALEEVSCSPLDYVHEVVVLGGPCLESPVKENTFVPPSSQVEVSYDGETSTIVSSGIEESVDEVRKPKKPKRKRSRVSFLKTGSVLRMFKKRRRKWRMVTAKMT
jgi:hypothetical protein